eukprot:6318078-Amphidinium_carterae.1
MGCKPYVRLGSLRAMTYHLLASLVCSHNMQRLTDTTLVMICNLEDKAKFAAKVGGVRDTHRGTHKKVIPCQEKVYKSRSA